MIASCPVTAVKLAGRWLLGLLCAWLATAAAAGVVVESVLPGPVQVAGLQAGDRLLSWRALGTQEPRGGVIASPFDLLEPEYGHMLLGAVELSGMREGQPQHWRLQSGSWLWTIAPELDATDAPVAAAAAASFAAGRIDEACAGWEDLAELLSRRDQVAAAAWMRWRCALGRLDAGAVAAAAAELPPEAGDRVWARLAWLVQKRRSGTPPAELLGLIEAEQMALEAQPQIPAGWILNLESARQLRLLGRLPEARSRVEETLGQVQRQAEGSLLETLLRQTQGQILRDLGDVPAAADSLGRAAQLADALQPSLEVAGVHSIHALILRTRGDYAAAEAANLRAIAMLRAIDPLGRQLANALFNLSPLYLDQGELNRADDVLREAITIQDRIDPSGQAGRSTLIALAALALERGELNRAQDYAQRAVELLGRSSPGSTALGSAYAQLGMVRMRRGDYAAAITDLSEADRIFQKTTPGSMIHTWILQWGAQARQSAGQIESARADLERVIALRLELAPDSLDLAKGRQALADLALAAGDLDQAAAELDLALPVLQRNAPNSGYRAHALHAAGRVARGRGETERALELLCQAVDVIEQQRVRVSLAAERRSRYSAEQRTLYDDCASARIDNGELDAAFEVIERSRARGLLQLLSDRQVRLDGEVPATLRAERDRIERELAAAELRAANAAELTEIQARQDEVIARIRHASPRYAELRYPEPITLAQAQAQLAANSAAIVYMLGHQRSHALILPAAGPAQAVELALTRDQAGALVREVLAAMAPSGRGGGWRDPLQRAYRLLLAPLQAQIAAAEQLLIVPDAELNLLPFAALLDDQQRHLVETSAIQMSTSLSLLQSLSVRPRSAHSELLAAADPAADGVNVGRPAIRAPGAQWEPLPFSRSEVQAIGALYAERSRTLTGAHASEDRLEREARTAAVLHLAVHGYFDPEQPLRSGLLLAPDASGSDGVVRVDEVIERWHLDADLVVLSACETGLGEVSASEGVYGLTRAFQFAGARSVLSSLWSVPDRGTAELMVEFHRLRHQGLDSPTALRRAQLHLLAANKVDAEQALRAVAGLRPSTQAQEPPGPWRWAAFVLHGAAR